MHVSYSVASEDVQDWGWGRHVNIKVLEIYKFGGVPTQF